MSVNLIARIASDGRQQSIADHSRNVAYLVESMLQAWASEDIRTIGVAAGQIHDIGKFAALFRSRLDNTIPAMDHTLASLVESFQHRVPEIGILASSHHTGLLDLGGKCDLMAHTTMGRYNRSKQNPPEDYSGYPSVIQVDWNKAGKARLPNDRFAQMMCMRMLESCLVDADRLDARSFDRQSSYVPHTISSMAKKLFDVYIQQFQTKAKRSPLDTERNKILSQCIKMGQAMDPGLYTLDVPTGGGKTIASMGFAVNHALRNRQQRILYVAPYLSVIDGSAETLTDIFGEGAVLQHHSQAEPDKTKAEYAVENWDSEIVVTTMVQLFESLFGSRASKLRKIHNITNSVVILDEPQWLPYVFLEPCVAAIHELIEQYRCSVVICTATPPALSPFFEKYAKRKGVAPLKPVNLCPFYDKSVFERVKVRFINGYQNNGKQAMHPISWSDLAKKLASHKQAMCITNTRKGAEALMRELEKMPGLDPDSLFLLTSYLIPYDRLNLIRKIQERLRDKKPCLLVATSLVEAGVNLDFPYSYREFTSISSIIQTAGRTNRHGKRKWGTLSVFLAEDKVPHEYDLMIRASWVTLHNNPGLNVIDAEMGTKFFEEYHREAQRPTENEIMYLTYYFNLPFEMVSSTFKLIPDTTQSMVIPVGEAPMLLTLIQQGKGGKSVYRKLQKYMVGLYENEVQSLTGHYNTLGDLLILSDRSLYDKVYGIRCF